MKRITMLLFIVMLVGVLTACGGDDGDTEEPQELPTIAGGAESTPPDFNDDAPPIEATPPISAPPGVSNAEGTAEARSGGLPPFDPGAQAPSRPDGEQTQIPSAPFNPAPSDVDPVADFSTLSEGDEVPVTGTVRSLENDSADNADMLFIIVDEQGNELDIEGLFFPMIASFDGDEAVLNGTVGGVSEETGRVVYNATVATAPTGADEAPAFIPPGTGDGDDAGASLPGAFAAIQGEPLDINLGADLTALEAYDALTSELGEQLGDATWLSVTGTGDLGWTFRFLSAEQETIAYFVQTDGAVSVAEAIAGPNVPGFAGNPIDREQVAVDSDVAEAQLPAASEDAPLNLGSVTLQADGEGNIVWVIGGAEAETIDATTEQ